MITTLLPRTHGRLTTDHPSAIPVPASGRPWLTRLFAGEVDLPAIAPAALPPADRTPAEAAILARALACPDLFVIDAANSADRERLITDILRLAAERGECVLALSPDPAASDRIVESLAAGRTLRVVRALADDENPNRPTLAVTRQTSRSLGSGRADQLKREAALAISTLEAKLARLERTCSLRRRQDENDRRRQEITAGLEILNTDAYPRIEPAQSDALALLDRLSAMAKQRDEAIAPLMTERTVISAKRAVNDANLAACQKQRAQASKKSGLFSRLFGTAKPAVDSGELERTLCVLETEAKELADRDANLQAKVDAVQQQFSADMNKLTADAIAVRRAALDAQLLECDAETARIETSLRHFLPQRPTPDDTVENHTPAPAVRADLERELAVARLRLQELTLAGNDLGRRLLAETQIVAGTPGCLEIDPVFKALPGSPPFGLLVLDHAEELTEANFLRLSVLAKRWVLAGDAAMPAEVKPHLNGKGHHGRHREPKFLARLARRLDAEPWSFEANRLVFRLVHVPEEQRQAFSREAVLDHPHVELRLSAGEGAEPVLAEIAFPAGTSVVQAKRFLVSQLGEMLLRPFGDRRWHRTDDRLTACWPLVDSGSGEWVELEPGVQELVSGSDASAYTAAIAFDFAADWNEEKAEAWLNEHTPAASASRLAALPRAAVHSVDRSMSIG